MKRVVLIAFLGLSFLPHEFISGMDSSKIDARDHNGDTKLHRALQNGEGVLKIQLLLNQGANPNLQDQYGCSAFCMAIQRGDLHLIELFLKKGAEVNPVGLRIVTTPLVEATKEFCKDQTNINRLNIVKLLLEKGANPNIRPDNYGATAIDIVIQNKNLDLLKLLFDHGAKVDTCSGWGEYPLHSAVRTQDLSIIMFLLNNKADPNVANTKQYTSVHLAAGTGNAKILQLLLEKNGDPNAVDYEQNSPLHDASNAQVVEILLKHKAEIDAKNKDGETPLHVAAREGNFDVIQALVKNKANISATNKKGEMPLVLAIYKAACDQCDWSKNMDILNMLLDEKTKLSYALVSQAIYFCAARDSNRLLEFILSKTSDFKGLKGRGVAALCVAIENKNLAGAEILIKYGADLNARSQSFDGGTPLHLAVSTHNIDAIKLLLANGAQINKYKSWWDSTPIHAALEYADHQAAEMIKIMLESQKVDVNSKEKVTNYMQENFDDQKMINNVISLLFPKKPEKKVSFRF